jgi:hypothetical protein
MTLTVHDLATIRRQIGREPKGLLDVEVRCPAGHPLVLKVYPLVRKGAKAIPFPTTFWLSCPRVAAKVARLEADGWIPRLETELHEDDARRSAIAAAHRCYAEERWALLTPEDRAWIEAQGWVDSLRDAGIGGIRDERHLKCLHLHHAHQLARSNPIGAYLASHFDLSPCEPEERATP